MAIATLSVDLVAKLAKFEGDMGKAARASEKTANQIAGAFGLIKSAAGGLLAGIGVGGFIALTRASIDSLDALNDVADATGATIENISALEDVAARTGTSMDSVTTTLVKFNQALGNAKAHSPIARALEAIGLSVAELRSLDPAEALRRTAVALSQYADDGNKARLVQELFGRSVREVAPFLKDLAEQSKLVATVTTEEAQAAEKFNKEIFAMQKNAQDLARVLVGPLVTAVNETADAFRRSAAEGKNFFEIGLDRYLENVRDFYVKLGVIEAKAKNSGGASGGWAEAGGGRGFINPAILNPSVSFDADTPGKSSSKPRIANPKVAKDIDLTNKALARYIDTLKDTIDRTENLTEAEKALAFLRRDGAGASTEEAANVIALAKQIDQTKELADAQEERIRLGRQFAIEEGDRVNAANTALAAQRKNLDDQINELSGRAGDDRKRALTQRLEEQLKAGAVFDPGELDRIVRGIGGVNQELEKSVSIADELGLSFASAFEDAIVGGKGLSAMFKGLEQDILRIVTRKMVTEPLGNAITGFLGGGGGSGGGIGGWLSGAFGKIFGFDGGGYTGDGPRMGGLDGRGGRLAMLHPRETVIDHTRGQSAGRSVVVNINQSFAPGTSRATTMQAAADARRQLEFAGRNL